MYGDTYAHLGWWGCLPFIYMGMLYRFLEVLVAGRADGQSRGTLAFLTLPAAYYAILMGTFNTFRAWNSSFSFGIPIILFLMWTYARFKNTQPVEDYLPEPLEESAPPTFTNA
jgi:hypothetical protein